MKTFNEFTNEYYTWNDDVTEKTIDLGLLYEEQEGDLDRILRTLQYEFRNSPDYKECKKIKLCSNEFGHVWKLTDNMIRVNKDKDGIVYKAEYGGLYNLELRNFKYYSFKIKIIKREFIPDDPYGEEIWDMSERNSS